jgi:UDP-3-O-[3-hydroxymyristoyl] glucosamine N-acyltransferase
VSEEYLSGTNWGWADSVKVHHTAIIWGHVYVGEFSRIDAFAVITGEVDLGRRVHIGHGAGIYGMGGVCMGDCSTLSPGSRIFTGTDDVGCPLLASPTLKERDGKFGEVHVGAFSVIGSNSVVLPNAQIGEEVQIAALSMVKGRIPDNQVWGGTPAKFIMDRVKLDREKMV